MKGNDATKQPPPLDTGRPRQQPRRRLAHALVLTTLPHAGAAALAWRVHPCYGALALASTAASVAWHAASEPRAGPLFCADYAAAAAWAAAEVWATSCDLRVVGATVAVAAANAAVDAAAAAGWVRYEAAHAAWHLASAARAAWVAGVAAGARA
jgi:hypothetical protein